MSVKIQTIFVKPFFGQWEEHPHAWEMATQQPLLIHAETYWGRLFCSVLLCSLVQHNVWLLAWVTAQRKVSFVSGVQLPCGKFIYRSMENNNVSAEFLPCSIEFLSKFYEVRYCRFFHKKFAWTLVQRRNPLRIMCPIVLQCVCDKTQMPPAVLKRVKTSSQMEHEQ